MNDPDTALYEQMYENILKKIMGTTDFSKYQGKFTRSERIKTDVYHKIKNKMPLIIHQINNNYLYEHGHRVSGYRVAPHSNNIHTVIHFNIEDDEIESQEIRKTIKRLEKDEIESQETKKTIKELKEMITQMYYSPGMPGYVLAKDDFEKKI